MGKSYKIGNPKVTIFGGSGFLGRYVVYLFARNGWEISVAVRFPKYAGFLKVYGVEGQISLIKADICNEKEVKSAIDGSDAVVNCVGILEEMGGSQKFDLLHNKYAARVAQIAKNLRVQRFTQISSLGASEGSLSKYSRSKRKGEKEIIKSFPEAVVLRPSIIFGQEDSFFNRFAKFSLFSPIIPLVGGNTKFQPIYVLDVAKSVFRSVTDTTAIGIFELGGPDVYSFSDLISLMLKIVDRPRVILNFPFGVALLEAACLTFIRKASFNLIPSVITTDQVKQLRYNNVVEKDYPGIESFGIKASSLRVVLPQYLWRYRKNGQFNEQEYIKNID